MSCYLTTSTMLPVSLKPNKLNVQHTKSLIKFVSKNML